jgi:quinolinate synthase
LFLPRPIPNFGRDNALLNMEPEITLPESIRKRAELPILRMLELSK